MRHNQAKFSDIQFLHGTVSTTGTTTTITTTATDESFTFTSSTFIFWGKSRTKASFSHCQLSPFEGSLARKLCFHIFNFSDFEGLARKHRFHIFLFQFQQLIQETSEPCHVLRLLAAHLGRATCAKKTFFQRKWFFQTLSFFLPLIVFPSAGFTPWSKNAHERGKGKGKRIAKEGEGKNRNGKGKWKGKGKEKDRKRKGNRKEKERKRKRKRKGKRTGKRKGEGKGRAKEETGKREKDKKGSVSHGPFLMPNPELPRASLTGHLDKVPV